MAVELGSSGRTGRSRNVLELADWRSTSKLKLWCVGGGLNVGGLVEGLFCLGEWRGEWRDAPVHQVPPGLTGEDGRPQGGSKSDLTGTVFFLPFKEAPPSGQT